jgi:hypothetical protein
LLCINWTTDAPVCKPGQKTSYGTSIGETIAISCDVESSPVPGMFYWIHQSPSSSLRADEELQSPTSTIFHSHNELYSEMMRDQASMDPRIKVHPFLSPPYSTDFPSMQDLKSSSIDDHETSLTNKHQDSRQPELKSLNTQKESTTEVLSQHQAHHEQHETRLESRLESREPIFLSSLVWNLDFPSQPQVVKNNFLSPRVTREVNLEDKTRMTSSTGVTHSTLPSGNKLKYVSEGNRSWLYFTPKSKEDYGSFQCWAQNVIGKQRTPCVFHVHPAGELILVTHVEIESLLLYSNTYTIS